MRYDLANQLESCCFQPKNARLLKSEEEFDSKEEYYDYLAKSMKHLRIFLGLLHNPRKGRNVVHNKIIDKMVEAGLASKKNGEEYQVIRGEICFFHKPTIYWFNKYIYYLLRNIDKHISQTEKKEMIDDGEFFEEEEEENEMQIL